MKTITAKYLRTQEALHEGAYGSSGHYWLGHVAEICDVLNCRSVLDYGAGKGTLGPYLKRLGIEYAAYDPVTFPKKPSGRFDLVVCLDVMEHIEEAFVPAVMAEIWGYTNIAMFCVVNTRASSKTLSDGRNAHITERPYEWWRDNYLSEGWKPARVRQTADGFDMVSTRTPPPTGVSPISRAQLHTLRGIRK